MPRISNSVRNISVHLLNEFLCAGWNNSLSTCKYEQCALSKVNVIKNLKSSSLIPINNCINALF